MVSCDAKLRHLLKHQTFPNTIARSVFGTIKGPQKWHPQKESQMSETPRLFSTFLSDVWKSWTEEKQNKATWSSGRWFEWSRVSLSLCSHIVIGSGKSAARTPVGSSPRVHGNGPSSASGRSSPRARWRRRGGTLAVTAGEGWSRTGHGRGEGAWRSVRDLAETRSSP